MTAGSLLLPLHHSCRNKKSFTKLFFFHFTSVIVATVIVDDSRTQQEWIIIRKLQNHSGEFKP